MKIQNPLHRQVARHSNGIRKAREIAEILGIREKNVQKIWKRYDLPRPIQGPPSGECNPAWAGGRVIELDGYVTIPGTDRAIGRSLEHRVAMEKILGRKLRRQEVVDHIDGCPLHNDPKNLRVFPSNAEHLRATLTGKVPRWSRKGLKNMRAAPGTRYQPVDTYNHHKKQGDVRLQKILLAHALLGKDSPYLLGTHRYLEKAGIPWRNMTKPQFRRLYLRLERDRAK